MTASEYYTQQFYTWEYRGKGWLLADAPIHLEPPFIPFYFHGFQSEYIDDGKKHNFISRFLSSFSSHKVSVSESPILNYETIDPYLYEDEINLEAIQIHLPKDRKVTPEKMEAVLMMLSYSHANISFEIIGTPRQIILQFVACNADLKTIETSVSAYFPECTIVHDNTFLNQILNPQLLVASVDFGLAEEFYRPINIPTSYAIDPLASICGIFDQLKEESQAGIQILFKGAVNNWGNSIRQSVMTSDESSFFEDDIQAPKLALEKTQSPLVAVTIRAFSQSTNKYALTETLQALSHAIMSGTHSPFNRIANLQSPSYTFEQRINDIYLRQSHRLGMLLNIDELSSLLHFPSESVVARKLFASKRKTVEISVNAFNKLFVLGDNYHNGITSKVTVSIEDRLKHTHIIGATGTGKSTLIANLISQDIAHNFGVILFDPHGDLASDVISLIPQHRVDDVVLIDPSDKEYSIGLNILQAHSEIEKEVLSSDLVASFRKFATSWGDQMSSVLGNALLAILEHKNGGSLHDLRRFLIESDFRNSWLKDVVNPHITYYWQKEYPLLKTNSIGSILTRLDTFLRPKSIRDMATQKKGLDFEYLLNSNKIILLKLSQGLIGKENSFLLGSLFLSKIHQAILQRQQSSKRSPLFMYLDEFQNFITPSIKEMLSGIRKYQVGLTISHQDLQQLQHEDGELLNSVLGNINNRIVFRVGEPDAKRLQDGFSHFTFTDLQNLGKGEAIIRIEQPQYDCSLDTHPLKYINEIEKVEKIEYITHQSRNHYGTKREDIEYYFGESKAQPQSSLESDIKPIQTQKSKEPLLNHLKPLEQNIDSSPKQDIVTSSVHRYLQTLIKKMAEQRGYIAGIEILLPNGSGQVDVLLTKDTKTIAVEICNTTDAEWEMHNIEKCITAKYDTVISVSGDSKQLERIKKKCEIGIPNFSVYNIHFFTPDALFVFLDDSIRTNQPPQENLIKGYRVNVSYDSGTYEDMERKRISVANVILNSLKKQRK